MLFSLKAVQNGVFDNITGGEKRTKINSSADLNESREFFL
jgi:hypothetical protein